MFASVCLGNALQRNSFKNKDEASPNTANHLETAMCISLPSDSSDDDSSPKNKQVFFFRASFIKNIVYVIFLQQIKKRLHESYWSESESPLAKRAATDQTFLNDALGIETISLSSGLFSSLPNQSLGWTSNDVTKMPTNLIGSPRFETNAFIFNMPVHPVSCQNSDSILEQSNGTDAAPKLMFMDSLATLKASDQSLLNSHINMNKSLVPSQLVMTVNLNNTNSIWPIGTSYQPDFVEIVVTDEEMNAYWDTLEGSF
ncbi:unnamed protein product [Rotaria sp. Silwood2]|nr:unnamed protein product [Rotaria sp. Silwood2]CAF3076577.1 unnamed protein product [Rotaria sp. Silwood2]CAF3290428.1 unnamed protein product [Rotaria sp. Silwood2]